MKMVEPMRKWTVFYDGEMIHQSTKERLKVKLQVYLKCLVIKGCHIKSP